jgi:hypothetical protein
MASATKTAAIAVGAGMPAGGKAVTRTGVFAVSGTMPTGGKALTKGPSLPYVPGIGVYLMVSMEDHSGPTKTAAIAVSADPTTTTKYANDQKTETAALTTYAICAGSWVKAVGLNGIELDIWSTVREIEV